MAIRRATGFLGNAGDAPETFWYSVKRRLLGPPMVNEELGEQRLSKPLALGVLSPDGISSSAYGTEEILIELLPLFGIAAFSVILPMTGVILFVMALVVLSYREVVMVYTRAGGSYVVARDNFGPRVAQVAAVALLVDYVVTVAVQIAGGTAAIASAIPALGPYQLEISVGVVLAMCYGNLRGIREAGKTFALPTYLFTASVGLMIVIGLLREAVGSLPAQSVHTLKGTYPIGHGLAGVTAFALVFTLLRSFANGGSSLTGIEAVSNAVSAFRPPEGINARRVLVLEGIILGSLVAGISWLAHATHAIPYLAGYPTVISQEASAVFGSAGHFMYFVVQAATALILYTGGNTSFNGFPFLTNFVAEDAFLPRWLTKRGHRLVFSNGIIVLTVLAIALLVTVGSNVNRLVPFYAIGVFTAFTMAGFGMARYHHRHKEQGWHHKLVINASAGVLSAVVVVIFAVVKFTEGAWLVVVLFVIGVPALIRLNREYRMEAEVLERIGDRPRPAEPTNYPRRTVYLLVDSFDLATLAALRYARSLRPTTLRAVHFVIDTAQADLLRQEWIRADRGVVLDFIDCPDRRLTRAAAELVSREAALPGTHVTVVLPRRGYAPLLGRLLHDRTADKIAGVVSQIPHSAATIVPFDVRSRLATMHDRQEPPAKTRQAAAGKAAEEAMPGAPEGAHGIAAAEGEENVPPVLAAPPPSALRNLLRGRRARRAGAEPASAVGKDRAGYDRPVPPPGVTPIGTLTQPGRATVEGRVRAVEIRPVERNAVLACEISDSTGDLTALFYGRSHIPGVICGARIRFRGPVGVREGSPVMINPAYELLSPGSPPPPTGEDS
ncbi:MAG TPA: amino acid permease [Streptosporangiaceae bacterium]|nr:amino acid permease [Streptosporangiaceae bacterium]